jgi:hypothetical protein
MAASGISAVFISEWYNGTSNSSSKFVSIYILWYLLRCILLYMGFVVVAGLLSVICVDGIKNDAGHLIRLGNRKKSQYAGRDAWPGYSSDEGVA